MAVAAAVSGTFSLVDTGPRFVGDCMVFFFSSRRRHTMWNCDWSSDVCSSDLALQLPRNAQLLLLGQRSTGALLAVAHGRVEYDQSFLHGAAPYRMLEIVPRCLLAPRPGTAELGLGLCAREAQQQTRERQVAESEAESDGAERHAGNIAGFSGYCNWAGRRFFHIQYTYPDSPYATKSRNSTIGGSEITRINPRTMSRITANGTDRRRLMPLKLWKGTLLTIVIPA